MYVPPVNLAIVVGVAKYTPPVSNLPACQKDVALMRDLLNLTNRFDDMLELSSDTSSAEIKTQLAQFVSRHKAAPVEELFFYYSGHGDVYKDDFYYLFSDFSDARRNQTSLTNSELDSILKALSPKLTVKVVDACHAGVAYVKEADALKKQLDVSKGRFADCYFMFSSQSSQASLQDNDLSDFTEAFVEGCSSFTGEDIRYRDIVDHISDAFAANADQTPTFVIQAPCLEVFCRIDAKIRKLLPKRAAPANKNSISTPASSALVDVIKEQAGEFCTREEALTFLKRLGERLGAMSFSSELKETYDVRSDISDSYEGIPGLSNVARWLTDNGGDYFAKVGMKSESYETEEIVQPSFGSFGVVGLTTAFEPKTRTVTRYRQVPDSFDCTAECPLKSIRLTALPRFDNLPHAVAVVVFVFSKRDCVIFYMFQTVKELDWGKLGTLKVAKWNYMTVVMKADLEAEKAAAGISQRFEDYLIKIVREKLGLTDKDAQQTSPAPSASGTKR